MRKFAGSIGSAAWSRAGLASTQLRRPFSEQLRQAFEKANIPYHPDLIIDFRNIVTVVKIKQEQFHMNPNSSKAFHDYAKVVLA